MSDNRIIVVQSSTRVWGPFESGDEALRWIEARRSSVGASELPLVMSRLVNPDDWGGQVAENLIDRSLEVFEAHQRKRGVQTDDVSFVGGFMSCFGVLTGRVDVGIPNPTPLQLFELIQRNLDDYRTRVLGAQAEERRNGG